MLWLNGIHTPTDVRPNAKTLMGSSLESALDPLGDQSFYYSAVRSSIQLSQGTSAGPNVSVGAAPDAGRIWVNRPSSWYDFISDLTVLLNRVIKTQPQTRKFRSLAQSEADLSGVSDAFAMAFVPPELMSDKEIQGIEREDANKWAYSATFDIVSSVSADLEAVVQLEGNNIGKVKLSVTSKEGRVKIQPKWILTPSGFEDARAECDNHLASSKWIKIFYESGHTVTQGYCYLAAYIDQPFDWSFLPFAGYNITQEKPEILSGQTLAGSIGAQKINGNFDDSLFAYVLDTIGKKGWLASDDGAMEFADFVHISDSDIVSLIHVKASKKSNIDRKVSVANYEVVVGQAVKNLRYLKRATLADSLVKGQHKQISGAVWLDGVKQPDRTGIIKRADGLPANYECQLIVLQPQLTENEYNACMGNGTTLATPSRILRMKQLNTLMLGARLSASAVGASFKGWAAK